MSRRTPCLSVAATLAGLAVGGASARAAGPLNVNFSFTATAGNTGTVSVEIIGPANNTTGPASDFIITAAPAADGFSLPFDYASVASANSQTDTFTVANGVITAENLNVGTNGPSSGLELNVVNFYDQVNASGG